MYSGPLLAAAVGLTGGEQRLAPPLNGTHAKRAAGEEGVYIKVVAICPQHRRHLGSLLGLAKWYAVTIATDGRVANDAPASTRRILEKNPGESKEEDGVRQVTRPRPVVP
jgi:hypothetical protein